MLAENKSMNLAKPMIIFIIQIYLSLIGVASLGMSLYHLPGFINLLQQEELFISLPFLLLEIFHILCSLFMLYLVVGIQKGFLWVRWILAVVILPYFLLLTLIHQCQNTGLFKITADAEVIGAWCVTVLICFLLVWSIAALLWSPKTKAYFASRGR